MGGREGGREEGRERGRGSHHSTPQTRKSTQYNTTQLLGWDITTYQKGPAHILGWDTQKEENPNYQGTGNEVGYKKERDEQSLQHIAHQVTFQGGTRTKDLTIQGTRNGSDLTIRTPNIVHVTTSRLAYLQSIGLRITL